MFSFKTLHVKNTSVLHPGMGENPTLVMLPDVVVEFNYLYSVLVTSGTYNQGATPLGNKSQKHRHVPDVNHFAIPWSW